MSRKTPPYPNYPEWTTARFFGFLRSLLRQGFNKYPPKYKTLNEAAKILPVLDKDNNHVRYKTGKQQGKLKYAKRYICASCGNDFMQKEVQVDHIVPAGQLKSFEDLASFAERLFCGADGLQVLCTGCHKVKTDKEKEERGKEN